MHVTVFTDGGSRGNPGPAAIGGVILSDTDELLYEFSEYIGVGTNNEAEYKAVEHVLQWLVSQAANSSPSQITFKLDSMLVVQQLSKNWKIKEPRMLGLARQCWGLLEKLKGSYTFQHVPRAENAQADALVNQALDAQQ